MAEENKKMDFFIMISTYLDLNPSCLNYPNSRQYPNRVSFVLAPDILGIMEHEPTKLGVQVKK